MKTIYELVRYHFRSYFKSSKFAMPLAILCVTMYCMYSMIPVGVLTSFTLSVICVFFLMVWVGLSCHTLEDPVSEQLLVLRTKSDTACYISDSAFLFLLGVLVSVLCTVFPIAQNLLNHNGVFLRPLQASDLISVFLLQSASAFAGSSVGMLLHPRIMKNRKAAIVLTALIAAMAIIKSALLQEAPILGAVLWIFPPMAEVTSLFTTEEYYGIAKVLASLGMLMGYGILASAVRILLLRKNKF